MKNSEIKSEKEINRFVVVCIEQYALSMQFSSGEGYKTMHDNGVIKDLIDDYEDLHGMSTIYLNNYIGNILGSHPVVVEDGKHQLAKTILIIKVIELIASNYKISLSEARDRLYNSPIIDLIDDDETGLYGDSALYIYSLYEQQTK